MNINQIFSEATRGAIKVIISSIPPGIIWGAVYLAIISFPSPFSLVAALVVFFIGAYIFDQIVGMDITGDMEDEDQDE